jgi:hypothetical protein
MKIECKKFGTILTSRPAGREAFGAIRAELKPNQERVELDFEGVLAVTPSWMDEFLSLLLEYVGNGAEILPTNNASVLATLRTLAKAKQEPVASFARRYLECQK